MGPDVRPSLRDVWLDLTDVTLADEDTNSILTDNANRAYRGNVPMQVTQVVTQVGTNGSGDIWWLNFEQMQVAPSDDSFSAI